jgi:hypothetical protein
MTMRVVACRLSVLALGSTVCLTLCCTRALHSRLGLVLKGSSAPAAAKQETCQDPVHTRPGGHYMQLLL